MKQYLEALNKSLIFKAVKTLLFLTPIILLTNRYYVSHFGAYHFDFHPEFMATFLLSNRFLPTFLYFAGFFMIPYLLETAILPFAVDLFIRPYNKKRIEGLKHNIFDRFLRSKKHLIEGISLLTSEQQDIFFTMLMTVPVTFCLWCIYFDKWYLYFVLVIIVYVVYAICRFVKGLNINA